jgi:hypothetical protein
MNARPKGMDRYPFRQLLSQQTTHLVICDASGNLYNVAVEGPPDIIKVREDKRPRDVETARNDVLGVLPG